LCETDEGLLYFVKSNYIIIIAPIITIVTW